MAKADKKSKHSRPRAVTPPGFRDYFHDYLGQRGSMMNTIAEVFQRYGFDQLETSAIEYLDVLGKFLPDLDRPNDGVFAWKEDERWLSLRYDLTAPLARVAAQHRNTLPMPYRRYTMGPVWRNEKPDLGRYRQFFQCDADTVGTASVAADSEMIILVADILRSLGMKRSDYCIKINNRKILDGILVVAGIIDESGTESRPGIRGTVFRSMDKLERLDLQGVRQLLGEGRLDESGDFTKGAGLSGEQADTLVEFLRLSREDGNRGLLDHLRTIVGATAVGSEGVFELHKIMEVAASRKDYADNVVIDTSIIRGLDYYTGPVLEAELTFEIKDNKGRSRRFGSVAGGGRYDDLVKRFTGQTLPATGMSIGVDRLLSAIEAKSSKTHDQKTSGPVLITVMDPHRMEDYFRMASQLREAGIRSEVFLGTTRNIGKQLKYADTRNCPIAIIQGEDEKARGVVQLKDLHKGAELAKTATKEEWRSRDWQIEINEGELVNRLRTQVNSD